MIAIVGMNVEKLGIFGMTGQYKGTKIYIAISAIYVVSFSLVQTI